MKFHFIYSIIFTLSMFLGFTLLAQASSGGTGEVRFSNDNLQTTTHPKPVSVTADANMANTFSLEGGKSLVVTRNKINGIKIWRFSLDDAFWWVTDKGIIWGGNPNGTSTQVVSDEDAYQMYLSR